MATPRTCEKCQARLSDHAAEGLCARCLAEDLLAVDYLGGAGPDDPVPEGLEVLRYFGDYEFLEALSRGGMGAVFRARQLSLNRIVAVKTVIGGGGRNSPLAKRFRVEAEAAASLQHPHIIPIHEFGEYGGELFLSMKYVEDACSLVDAGLPPREAIRSLIQVSRAVHHAHQHGVLHRDLKPSNVLVGRDGIPYLTDFGLAKLATSDGGLTLSQETLGTPAYMAPEQASGGTRDVTVAVDVYGLGAILYEMLTGRPPFSAPTTAALLRQVIDEEPAPPRRVLSERRDVRTDSTWVDRDLETVCLKALAKQPARRYPDAASFADDLERWLRHEPVQARPTGALERAAKWVRRRPVWAASMAFLVLGLIGVTLGSVMVSRRLAAEAERQRLELVRLNVGTAMSLLDQHDAIEGARHGLEAIRLDAGRAERESMQRLRYTLIMREVPALEQVLEHDGAVNTARFSTSGDRLITASDDRTARVWDLTQRPVTARVLVHGTNVANAALSPDGRHVLTVADDGRARLWDAETGSEIGPGVPALFNGYKRPFSPTASFSPDGSQMMAIDGERVTFWKLDGVTPASPPLLVGGAVQSACFGSQGDRVLTASWNGRVELWSLGESERWVRIVAFRHVSPNYAWLNPDDSLVLSVATDNTARVWNAVTGKPVSNWLRHDPSLRLHLGGFSPDGRLALTGSFDNTIQLWDLASAAVASRRLEHPKGIATAGFSPDSRTVITTGFDGTVRLWDVETGLRSGPSLHHVGHVYAASFSADGALLATGGQDRKVRVWRMAPRRHRLSIRNGPPLVSAMVPSGRDHQLMTLGLDGLAHVWDLESGERVGAPFRNTGPVATFVVDDSGKRAAFATATGELRLWDVDSRLEIGPARKLQSPVASLHFNPDARWLVSVPARSRTGVQGRVTRWEVNGTRSMELPVPSAHDPATVAWSPDRRWLATGGMEGTAYLWDAESLRSVGKPMISKGTIQRLAFSPESRWLATTESDWTYNPNAGSQWSVPGGEKSGLPLYHRDGVSAVAYSRDGRWLATGGEDGAARLWRTGTGEPVTRELIHDNKVQALLFSPDGRLLVTGTAGGAVRLWDAMAGEPLTRAIGGRGPLVGLAFCRGGRDLMMAWRDGTVDVWDLTPVSKPIGELEAELARLGVESAGR